MGSSKTSPSVRPRFKNIAAGVAVAFLVSAGTSAWGLDSAGQAMLNALGGSRPIEAAPALSDEAERALTLALNPAADSGAGRITITTYREDPEAQGITAGAALKMMDTLVADLTSVQAVGLSPSSGYWSPDDPLVAAGGLNTRRAVYALNALLNSYAPGSSELEMITASLKTVTPEYAVASGTMAVNVVNFIHRQAIDKGLRLPQLDTIRAPIFAQAAGGRVNKGPRIWGGYAGAFREIDSSGGYFGHDQNTSAAVLGMTYDFGPQGSVGFFAAYTSSEAKFGRLRSINESDGYHLGIMGRLSPYALTDPNFSLYADAGYAHFQNKGHRYAGGSKVKGKFDQNVYTLGLGAEYVAAVTNDVMLTPAASVRYTRLDQGGFREKGLTAAEVKGFTVDSLTTNLSLTASTDITINEGIITPALKIGWRREYLDRDYRSQARYHVQGLGYVGDTFTVGTVPVDTNTYDVGLSVRSVFDTASGGLVGLNVSYDYSFSRNATAHSVYGGVEYRF